MLKNLVEFTRGMIFGVAVGAAAGLLFAPGPGDETRQELERRIQATVAAFEQGRAEAERELRAYFEQARAPSTEEPV